MKRLPFIALVVIFLSSFVGVGAKEGDTELALKTEWIESKLKSGDVSPAKRLDYIDTLLTLTGDSPRRFYFYRKKLNALYALGRYRQALSLVDSVLPTVPDDSLEMRLHLKYNAGFYAFTLSDYSR